MRQSALSVFFFFNDTATTEIYTLSLHDALPICMAAFRTGQSDFLPVQSPSEAEAVRKTNPTALVQALTPSLAGFRSEEHTSELQSQSNLVCRLLLEKKKNRTCGLSSSTS